MNAFPLIHRELRRQARAGGTYALRWLGGGLLMLVAVLAWSDIQRMSNQGAELFRQLHCVILAGIWALVPLLTADVISRERREGTLGLLFLTPLTCADVVVAKGVAQWCRTISLGVAAIPVLIVPLLLGGVSQAQVGLSVALNGLSLLLALSAGLLGSAGNESLRKATLYAYVWAFFAAVWLMYVTGQTLFLLTFAGSPVEWSYWGARCIAVGALALLNPSMIDDYVGRPGAVAGVMAWKWMSGIFLCGLLGLVYLGGAALCLRGRRASQPPSAARQKLEHALFTPRLAPVFYRSWLRRKLERNPIGWLERRTWQARLVTWSWLAALVSLYSALLTSSGNWVLHSSFHEMQTALAHLMAFSMILTAAGSFRRERESGFLELILVSPMSHRELFWGRLWGLWVQFLPVFLLWAGVWFFLGSATSDSPWGWPQVWFGHHGRTVLGMVEGGLPLIALPVVGLYFSLRTRHYLSAVAATLVLWLLVKPLIMIGAEFLTETSRWVIPFSWDDIPTAFLRLPLYFAYWLVLALFLGHRLLANFARHQHVLRSGD